MTRAGVLVPASASDDRRRAGKGEQATRKFEMLLATDGRGVVTALVFLSVILLFAVSPIALVDLGFNYGDSGGSFIEKIHPGTWIAIVALMVTAIGRGNPLTLGDAIIAHKGLTIFLASFILTFAYVAFIRRAPATPLIDTFLLPIILFLLVSDTSESTKRTLGFVVHIFMAANALLGIAEYLGGFQLTPQAEELGAFAADWRSTALFGHPLANAMMTGAYVLALSVGGGRTMAVMLRPFAIVVQLVAMITFGGRASLVTTLILLAGVALTKLIRILRGARFDLLSLAILCFALPFAVLAGAAAAEAGFFGQMLERFVSDNGSASTRVIMFKLFDILPLRDIILGPDLTTLASIQYLEGINYGIESFWIGFIITNGLAISVIFFIGLAAFCMDLVRVTRPATGLLLFSFFAVASTSVSLSAKTSIFAMFVVMVLTLMRREPGHGAALVGRRR